MYRAIYYFIDKFEKKEIEKLNKNVEIIFRNYSKQVKAGEMKKLVKLCRKQHRKVYISNDLKTAISCNFNGVYLPSFNKILKYKNISKQNLEIIGSAHNIKDIRVKQMQGCNKIFLAPLFKTSKNNNFLDVIKFNIIKLGFKLRFISLGGIDSKNLKREKLCKSFGLASISWIKKNGPSVNTGPFLKIK
tara:strand:+ start:6850 stop:7416 length:567 start_codon:yes stop_codon:yes gene_type:complete